MLTHNQMAQIVAVARNHSITKASEELYVAQPAISATIKKAEEMLGTKLFYYQNKQMYLTKNGEQIYEILVEIMSLYQKLENFKDDNAHLKEDNVYHFYGTHFIHAAITPNMMLFDTFPRLFFTTYICNDVEEFCNLAQEKENAIGVFMLSDDMVEHVVNKNDFEVEIIIKVPVGIMASSKNNSEIVRKKSVSIEELKDLRLIKYNWEYTTLQDVWGKIAIKPEFTTDDMNYIDEVCKRMPDVYSVGMLLPFSMRTANKIFIPIENVPPINYAFLMRKNEKNKEIYQRISRILHNLLE